MDQEEIQKKIYERLNNLQPEIRGVLMDATYDQKIADISKKYQLTTEQMGVLELNTTFVLLGQTHPDEYGQQLMDDLKLPKEKIDPIIMDINQQILKDVLDMIKQNFIDDKNTEDNSTQKTLESRSIINPTTVKVRDPKFSAMPENVQDAIALIGYQKKLYDIAINNKLPISSMGKLEDVTVRLITGAIAPTQYESSLILSMEVEASKANAIATQVNDEIMKPIRLAMQEGVPKKVEVVTEDTLPLPPYKQETPKPLPAPVVVAEKIPTPPPAPIAVKQAPTNEVGIYADAGIEMLEEELKQAPDNETATTLSEDQILVKSGISMIEEKPSAPQEHLLPNEATQKKALEGIEHPANVASSIIGAKMAGATQTIIGTSDHSLPKMTPAPLSQPQKVVPRVGDSYREPIE